MRNTNEKEISMKEVQRILNENVGLFCKGLDHILQNKKERLKEIKSVTDYNLSNKISRLKSFAEGLAKNKLENFIDSSEINKCFIKQYSRLDELEAGLNRYKIKCNNLEIIKKSFAKIDFSARGIMMLNSDIPPLF